MRKRLLSVLLALCMLLSLCPMAAFAAEGDDESALIEVTLTEEERALYDERLADALMAKLLGMDDVGTFSTGTNTAGSKLDTDEKAFYEQIKTAIVGTGDSTGIAKVGGPTKFTATKDLTQAQHDRVYHALCFDLPYEMYWRGSGWSRPQTSGRELSISVSTDYQGENEYTVNPDKAAAKNQKITTATTKVASILSKVPNEEGTTDYEKLAYFKDTICGLVTYDTQSANTEGKYGDP